VTARTVMVQGTASSVGKSVLVAALCRIFRDAGWRVAPFKAQNMSLNSYVTREGGEMGRAQVVQALAAGVEPHVDMNPILLKPEADARSQVVVLGSPVARTSAREYYARKAEWWPVVVAALERLRSRHELVIIEGAGSPAEINLVREDIANMRVARAAESPVLLVADIDRGGVFAALYGTVALLPEEERSLVRGMIVNKFRGDPTILEPGLRELERITSVPVLGVVPYLSHLAIPEEDSVFLEGRQAAARTDGLDVSVIRVERLANSNDFEALEREPGVSVRYVRRVEDLGSPDLVVLPGSKSTVADLRVLRESGLADGVVRLALAGTPVIGICGGYQMLGRSIRDPGRVESEEEEVEGLGLLDVVTEFSPEKSTHLVRGRVLDGEGILGDAAGKVVEGYEIHMGRTRRLGARPLIEIAERGGRSVKDLDGAAQADGHIAGTYLHGLFDNSSARGAILAYLARRRGLAWPAAGQAGEGLEEAFGRLAAAVRGALDMTRLRERCGL